MSAGGDATDLRALARRVATTGRIEAIWLRPARDVASVAATSAVAIAGRGLEGDRTSKRSGGGRRQVTLIQAEHLPTIGAFLGRGPVDAALLRRNVVVSGINLLGLRSPFADVPIRVRLGPEVLLEITGPCDPCSKIEAVLGPGAWTAMRGHGGVTARVLEGGTFGVGDAVDAVA